MKNLQLSFVALILFLVSSCGGKNNGGNSEASGSVVSADEKTAVCIWDNLPLKETPSDKGKWLSSISIGETATYLDEEKTDDSGKSFIKVRLKDNKEGWAQGSLIILNSKAAAVTEDAEVYTRPDLLNKSGKSFSKMDIVAVKSEKDGFIEVTGKRKNGKWVETGWMKNRNVSYEQVDIAVAKFARKAAAIADSSERASAIKEIVNNPDLKTSVFISLLEEPVREELKTDTVYKNL